MPSRRSVLATAGAALGLGAGAAYRGAVAVPRLSPVWRRWRQLDHDEQAGQGIAVLDGALLAVVDRELHRLAPDDGSLRWSVAAGESPVFGLGTGDGVAVTGDREVVAVDPGGTVRWRRRLSDTHEDLQGEVGLGCRPFVGDGRAVVSAYRSRLLALDLATGDADWAVPLDGWEVETLAGDGRTAYAVLGHDDRDHGRLLALDAATGDRRWTRRVPTRDCSLAVGDALYCGVGASGDEGGVRALAPADGRPRWRRPLAAVNAVTASGGAVYVAAGSGVEGDPPAQPGTTVGSPSGVLVAFDAADGRVRWRTAAENYGVYPPTVTDDGIYVASLVSGRAGGRAEGSVLAYAPDGAHRWTAGLGEDTTPSSRPVVHEGSVYVAGDRAVVAFGQRV